MIYTELTKKAFKIAYYKHHGHYDKGGMPYIFHPVHLAEQMETEAEICTALLHDVVEDTNTTLLDLKKRGFSPEIIEAIDALTRRENESYEEYIERLSKNLIALKVKKADLEHNMDLSRLSFVTFKDKDRSKKYEKYLKKLEKR